MMMALHFLAGANKGKEFLLPEEGELILGRTDENDVLVDDPDASHKHAVVSTKGGQIILKNLDDKLGTFVNRMQIDELPLEEGDRIRICKITFMLVTVNRFSTALNGIAGRVQQRGSSSAPKNLSRLGSSISGSIKDVPMVDLLQFLCNAGQSGVLALSSGHKSGTIHLLDGQVCGATLSGSSAIPHKKAFHRMLRWKSGTFSLEPPDHREITEGIKESFNSLLLEAAQMTDSMAAIESVMPKMGATLTVAKIKPGSLKDLSPQELNLFGLIHKHSTVQEVLDNYPEDDLEACTLLISLIQRDLVYVD
jgi:pSer/pThr/pTyr-binding forkhead associated (FHA) protein